MMDEEQEPLEAKKVIEEKKEEEQTHNFQKVALYNGASDMQIQQWYMDQKCTLAGVKRQQYWGEPKDCHSLMQINNDNYYYQLHLNRQLRLNQGKEEQVITIETTDQNAAILPPPKQIPGKIITKAPPVQHQTATAPRIPIKDQKEYEFLES